MNSELPTPEAIQARLNLLYQEAQQHNSLSILAEIQRLEAELERLAETEIIY